jgi:hypothetical protein
MVTEPQGEQTYISNAFGTVTNRRVIYFRAKGWFSGGSREDIPLKHVTSVRVDIKRHPVAGIVLGLIGLRMLASGEAGVIIGGLVLIALAGLLLWGSPSVVVNTAGQDLSAARGFPWQRNEANAFAETLRKQLFRE